MSCLFAHEIVMYQVFQLTTHMIRGSASRDKKFVVILDCVAVKEEDVRGVLLCVQDFVRSPHFTQKSFFSGCGLTMLSDSVAIAVIITSSPVYATWSVVETACASQVITDLLAYWDQVVLCRRAAKDASEHWYHGGNPRSNTASRPGVQISDVVEEGRVENAPVASPALGPPGSSKIRSSSSKRKRNISRDQLKFPRKYETSSPPTSPQWRSLVEDPSFASALAAEVSLGKSRWSGRDRRAASVFQMGFR